MNVDTRLNSCTLADLQTGRVATTILPRLSGEGLVLGRVRTAQCAAGDILGAMEAIDRVQPGEVLMFGVLGEDAPHCFLGDNMAFAAAARGALGFVIDGYLRDLSGIREIGLTVHARGQAMGDASASGPFDLENPVTIDGVEFRTGDGIALDDDGIARFPFDELDTLLAEADAVLAREKAVRDAIRAGQTLREAHRSVGYSYGG